VNIAPEHNTWGSFIHTARNDSAIPRGHGASHIQGGPKSDTALVFEFPLVVHRIQNVQIKKSTPRDALAPYPWSRSVIISRCFAEGYGNGDQRRAMCLMAREGLYFTSSSLRSLYLPM